MDRHIAKTFSALLGFLIFLAALEEGAHDLWAATFVHLSILGLALGALLWTSLSRRSPGFSISFAFPLGLLALALGLSAGGSVNPGESVLALKDWLAGMAAFLAAVLLFREDAALEPFLAFLPPVFLMQLAVSIYQRAFQGHFWMEAPPGTLGNANLTAAFLIIWVPVFADLTLRKRKDAGAWWYWAAGLALNLSSLLLSFTMWGFFCLVLGLGLWLAARWGKKWIGGHVRLAGSLSAGALAFLFGLAWWKLNRTYNWEGHPIPSGTQTSRLMWWASALRMFSAHRWRGVGLGNFPSAYLAYKVGGGQNTLFAHSFPLGFLAETGLLGCAGLLFFLGWWLKSLINNWEKVGRRWPFLLGAGMFLAFGTISLSVEYLVNLLVFWIFLGIAAAPGARDLRKFRPSILIVSVLLGLAAVPYIAAPFLASRVWVSADERLAAGDLSGAVRAYASAAAMDSLSFEAERGWAKALYAQGERDGAVLHQRRAVALNRLQGILWWELGNYLRLQGRSAEAARSLDQARALNGQSKN